MRTIYVHDTYETLCLLAKHAINELQWDGKLSIPIENRQVGRRFAEALQEVDIANKIEVIYVWNWYVDIHANCEGLRFVSTVVDC